MALFGAARSRETVDADWAGTSYRGETMTRAEQDDDAWTPRPVWARIVCVLAASVPVLVGAVAAITLSRWLPTTSTLAGTVFRVLLLVAASTAAVFVADRAARRLLPLAAIYRLSLVFP